VQYRSGEFRLLINNATELNRRLTIWPDQKG
jgi:hypothetical protein